jgi:heme ABC exporter ATP-binding subunit CcmA
VVAVASGAIIRLRAAVALLDGFPALAGADLDVDGGEVVLLQGPNGAGKSTLLRVCAGLVSVASGEAVVLGCDLRADRRAVRRRVGLLGHATFLYDDLSVRENVTFAVRAAGADSTSVAPALDRLGLAGRLASVSASRLSAGQRRRVAVAIVAARQPELWLLDEPHAGLDAEGRDLLDALIGDAVASGATVLMASHEVERSAPIATRTLTVAGGQVLAQPAASAVAVANKTVVARGVPAHVA